MGSRDGVEERGTVLVRGFYKAGTKMTPHFRDGIGVPLTVLFLRINCINTRMPNSSSYAINCAFFAIYLNSRATWLDCVTELNIFAV